MKSKIDKVNSFKLPVQDRHKAKDLDTSLRSPQKGIEPKQLLQPSIPHKSNEDPKHNKLAGQSKLDLPINKSSLVIQPGSVSDIIKKPMNPSAEQPASIINKLEIDKQVADAVSQLGVTNFNNLVKAILGTVEREVQTNTGVSDQAGSLSDFNPVLRGIESQFERLAASMNNETISSSSRSNLDVPLSDLLANLQSKTSMVTVEDAAHQLGIVDRTVRKLIQKERVPAELRTEIVRVDLTVERLYVDLPILRERYASSPKPGRPKKNSL